MTNKQPKNITVILWLIFFFPVGLYLMWAKTNWNKTIKIAVSVILALLCIVSVAANGSDTENETTTQLSSTGIVEIDSILSNDIQLDLTTQWNSSKSVYFTISPDGDYSIDDFELVSNNTEIATVEFERIDYSKQLVIKVVGITAGETVVYVQTKDGVIKSDEIKVICTGEKPTTTEATTQEPTTEEPTTEETTAEPTTEEKTTKDNSRTVYTTPTGEKYHFSKSCAGKNARERTLNEVKDTYDPCKKCAQ